MGKLLKWSSNIVNHFWHSNRTCNSNVANLKVGAVRHCISAVFVTLLLLLCQVKWTSVLHHVQNEHEWLSGRCDHKQLTGPPTDGDGNELQYFARGEPALQALRKLVLDKKWLKSLSYYTKFRYMCI